MATRTPETTSGAVTTDRPTVDTEPQTRRLVDVGNGEPTATTASRAVRPPVVVRNKRLADDFGEAYLVWRCLDCGTVGSLDALPERCVCGAHREDLSYVVED